MERSAVSEPASTSGTSRSLGTIVRPRRRAIRSGLAIVASLYLGIQLCLAAWIAVPALALGWTPRVVLSDSMRPSIRSGDVVVADPSRESRVTVGALVIVERTTDDGTNVHRVAERTADGRFRTKGDANTAFDPSTVDRADVRGVGRLLVPAVGTPVMWWQTGQHGRALAWVVSIVVAVRLSWRPRKRTNGDDS